MIFGIGTDIVAVERMDAFWRDHGERGIEKILAPQEYEACRASKQPGKFLAKRFAAKEALGKAFGTGIREPVLFTEIAVIHDDLGKPMFEFGEALARHAAELGVTAHLSISDEKEHAIAFVILEKT